MVPRMVRPVASVSAGLQALEARLDVGRQQLQRAHVERLRQLLDFFRIELHGAFLLLKDQRHAGDDQQRREQLPEPSIVEPPVDDPAEPPAGGERGQCCDQ